MRATDLTVLSLAAAMVLTAPARAQGRPGSRPGALSRPPLRQAMDQLGLTPLQRRQLRELRQGQRLEQTSLNRQIPALRRELAELYRAYPLDEPRANLLIQQIGQLELQRLRLQLQNQVALRRILTPDQFARFSQMMEPGPRPALPSPGRVPGP